MSNIRYWRFAAVALAVVLVLAVVWNWQAWEAKAQVGAAYGARMTCSCRYVEGRDMQSCEGDTEPGMEIVTISDSPEEKAVSAWVPMMAERTARYRKGWGCLLD